MAERISAQDIPGIIDRLVEAWYLRSSARRELEHYRATVARPVPPHRFSDVNRLIAYYQQKERYEAGVAEMESKVTVPQTAYDQTARLVQWVLPMNSPLIYTYQGERDGLKDRRYIIRNTGTEVIVEGPVTNIPHL